MAIRNSSERWGSLAQFFHWLIFLLMVGAWIAVEAHEGYPKGSDERAQWMMLHKAMGLSVFFLVWLRLGWRLANPVPAPEPAAAWQLRLAGLTHVLLYGVMIAMPAAGLLASQFAGREVSWFGLFTIPVGLAPDKALAGALMALHKNWLWPLLLGLLVLHVGAALWHHFVRKDRTLRRMLPFA